MTFTEKCPVLGERQYRMTHCKPCDGTGKAVYHVGCGDMSPGDCGTCYGSGYSDVRARFVYRGIGPTTYGPWTRNTGEM